jgi:long-chain fatty acid transport protein
LPVHRDHDDGDSMTASSSLPRRALRAAAFAALAAGSPSALAGGIILYEVGTADVGLAAAGYGARAQDASTVLTNPAGMTRLDGTQVLAAGQLLWGDVRFSIGGGTSPALGGNNGGHVVGQDGWFLGGGAFTTYRVSPDVTLGFAATGNFGMPLNYDEDWVGRYYVQKATLGRRGAQRDVRHLQEPGRHQQPASQLRRRPVEA